MARTPTRKKSQSSQKKTTAATSSNTKADHAVVEAKKARLDAARARAEAARARAVSGGAGALGGFVNFVREKGVVGLAIGLAIGTAATGLVTQIVNAVITPTLGLLIGQNGLKGLNLTATIGNRSEVYAIGDLIDALIKFIAVAAVIYFVVMGFKLDKLDKKKDA